MTVREMIQLLLLNSPNLDADVYISKPINEVESKSYSITSIDSHGNNDSIDIEIEDSKWFL